MTDQNVQLLRSAYDAFAQGDIPTVLQMLSPRSAGTSPGAAPCRATTRATTKSSASSSRRWSCPVARSESAWTRSSPTTIGWSYSRRWSAERNGRSWSSPEVHIWHVVDGKAVDFHEFQGDQQSEDEFWLS